MSKVTPLKPQSKAETLSSSDPGAEDDITELRLGGHPPKGNNSPPPKVLKQRFVLDVRLGSGGMGTVYRAKDLRKVEAKDRNPYVAVKVLNSDFREHPDAFIALQREASKSQTLSHPNIVSIYDFDKDGDTPFMTMELLQGQELAQLLKQYPNGLPDNIAWPVIQGMCAGLKRAHDAGITHADFKPGNVFVTTEHQAKILDFGIARAVQAETVGSSDDTHFDPRKLAALTPAYASLEMLQGDSPEPRDDIYALGVCIYQILTGHHPYERAPADQAEEENLIPLRCDGLSRRQWSILQSMLAFRRQDRPAGMDIIIERLLAGSPLRVKLIWGALALALLMGAVSVFLDSTTITQARQSAARDALLTSQVQRIDELLAVPAFDEAWKQRLAQEFEQLKQVLDSQKEIENVRQRILQAYAQHLSQQEDFDAAVDTLNAAKEFTLDDRFAEGESILRQRLLGELDQLLDKPTAEEVWVTGVETVLARFHHLFPNSPVNAELQNESGEVYLSQLNQVLRNSSEESDQQAEQLYQAAAPRIFDFDALQPLRDELDRLRSDLLKRQRLQIEQNTERAYLAAKDRLQQSVSCQRVALPPLYESLQSLQRRFPAYASRAQAELVGSVATCIRQVAEYDQDKALSLRNEAQRIFGNVRALKEIKIDPCAMRYLVGNGAQRGRSGFCSDNLTLASGETASGPRLVVVMGTNEKRFAISKYELDGKQFALYCEATGNCVPPVDQKAPVVGIDLQQAKNYAAWLSTVSGYRYRLPEYSEWLQATGSKEEITEESLSQEPELDPNRNCSMSVAGVERGQQAVPVSSGNANAFGLVNLVGNVREWVTLKGDLYAAGGSFKDPIDECTLQTLVPHDGSADSVTGIRLVRDLP